MTEPPNNKHMRYICCIYIYMYIMYTHTCPSEAPCVVVWNFRPHNSGHRKSSLKQSKISSLRESLRVVIWPQPKGHSEPFKKARDHIKGPYKTTLRERRRAPARTTTLTGHEPCLSFGARFSRPPGALRPQSLFEPGLGPKT